VFVPWPTKKIAARMESVWLPPRKRIAARTAFVPRLMRRTVAKMVSARLPHQKKIVAKVVSALMGPIAKRAAALNLKLTHDQKIKFTAAPVMGAAVLLCPI
jgi:hypothetical protein